MLAAEITNCRTIRLLEVPDPQLTAEQRESGLVVFEASLGCLCGSDLPFFDGDFEGHEIAYPQPVGMSLHEIIGHVVESGSSEWAAGTRVVAVPERQLGFFERFVVSARRLIAVPDGLPDEQALMAQPFGTVLHALRKMPNLIGLNVVVLGQGPIGQMFNAGLRNLGAQRIIGVDPLQSRLACSQEMGAHATVCAEGSAAAAEVESLLEGVRPDIVIEAVGHRSQAVNAAIDLVRNNGTILLFGVLPQHCDGVALRAAMWKNAKILTSIHPDFERTFPLAMNWIHEGRVDFQRLLTHRFSVHEVQQAFDVFRDRTDGAQKVLLDFRTGVEC